MGTKYTTTSVGGYNSAPPSDDGSITIQNLGKWSDVKTKLSDPLNTAVASIDSKLTSMMDVGPVVVSTNYTVTSSDFMKTLYVTATATISMGDAASLGSGFYLYILSTVDTATIGRVTSGNTINGAATNIGVATGFLTRVQVLADTTGFFTSDYQKPLGGSGIVNGALAVWQDGTSFAAVADATYVADNFKYRKTGTMVDTAAQAAAPTVAAAGLKLPYSLKCTVTTAQAALAIGDYQFIETFIEGYQWNYYAQRACTLEFVVNSSVTGTFCVNVRNSGNDQSFIAEYTVNSANTDEKKTIAITSSPSAGTWDYVNGAGAKIGFVRACGSTFQGATGWQASNKYATANQVNAVATLSSTFSISGVKISPGPVSLLWTPDQISYRNVLTDCERLGEWISGVLLATNDYALYAFRSRKRTKPTIERITFESGTGATFGVAPILAVASTECPEGTIAAYQSANHSALASFRAFANSRF